MTEKNYHQIPYQDDADFISCEENDFLPDKGIRTSGGKLKSDPDGPIHIRQFLFDTETWSFTEADKWVQGHKKGSGIEKRSFDTMIGYSKEDHNEVRLNGLAIPYGRLSDNPIAGFKEGVKERILSGAFTKSLESGRDVMMLWNHELKYIFGRTTRGTLALHEDEKGVNFANTPPDSGWAKDLLPSIKRGDYSNMSFSFKDDVRAAMTLEDGKYVRNVSQATLYEISLVPYAVYETTSVGLRGSGQFMIDGMMLPDPLAEQKRSMEELDKFKDIEEKFNNLKEKWL